MMLQDSGCVFSIKTVDVYSVKAQVDYGAHSEQQLGTLH